MTNPAITHPPLLQRSSGTVKLGFKHRDARTVLDDLYQQGSAKVRFPNVAPPHPPEAVLINTSGGLTDGDVLEMHIRWGARTHARVTGQAAERIYQARSGAGAARITTHLHVEEGALAEWLPQETIFFDGGGLTRETTINLHGSGRLLACEAMVFGRMAMGEVMTKGQVYERWRVHVDDQLVWTDALRMDPLDQGRLDRGAIAGGARALATILYVGEDAANYIDAVRAELENVSCFAGATCMAPVLLIRLAANDGAVLRKDMITVLEGLTRDLLGCAPGLPRVWHC